MRRWIWGLLCALGWWSAGGPGLPFPPALAEELAAAGAGGGAATALGPAGVVMKQERVSLDLKGVEISELLRILARKMNLTIVPTRGVTGRVNVFLNNLTFEDALEVILVSQDLASERNGDVIQVMTAPEYERLYGRRYNEKRAFRSLRLSYAKPAAVFNAIAQVKSDIGKIIVDEGTGTLLLLDIPEKLELMEETVQDLDQPLPTEVFDLKYAKSADIKTHLTSAVTAGPGELLVDEKSSKVVVTDLPARMQRIQRIVKAFDEATLQVFIEAEIVQITLKNEYQQGINWEKIFKHHRFHGLDFKGTFPVATSFSPSPALTAASLAMTVGTLLPDDYTTTIQFLNTFGATKILSRPRLAVVNNQEAKILVGAREAYVTQTLSQAQSSTVTSESVQFVDVGIKLSVVPTINREGFVTMRIKPEVSSVRETLTTALGSKVPIVETSEAETVVKVKDGTMILIAGLMKGEKRQDVTGIPILNRIPFIRAAFSSKAQQRKNTETVIFLTPRLIPGDATVTGAEPERRIPPDMMPDDLRKRIILQQIEHMGRKRTAPTKWPWSLSSLPPAEAGLADPDAEVQKKMKGPKEH